MTGQVYRFYDEKDDLLYIGSSCFALRRIDEHRAKQPWFNEITLIRLENYPTRQAAYDAEVVAIRAEKPKYNITQFVVWENLASPPILGKKCPSGCSCGRHAPIKWGIVAKHA